MTTHVLAGGYPYQFDAHLILDSRDGSVLTTPLLIDDALKALREVVSRIIESSSDEELMEKYSGPDLTSLMNFGMLFHQPERPVFPEHLIECGPYRLLDLCLHQKRALRMKEQFVLMVEHDDDASDEDVQLAKWTRDRDIPMLLGRPARMMEDTTDDADGPELSGNGVMDEASMAIVKMLGLDPSQVRVIDASSMLGSFGGPLGKKDLN